MNLQHVNVVIYTDGEPGIRREHFIDVFHRWIREGTLDELLIDVVDYRHVPAGPDVILAGHAANYSLERFGTRYGLRYNRKARLEGSNTDRFVQAYEAATHACRLLEREFRGRGGIRFSRQSFSLFINDRALAPNTPEAYTACRADLESFVRDHLGEPSFVLEPAADPLQRFGVNIRLARARRFAT